MADTLQVREEQGARRIARPVAAAVEPRIKIGARDVAVSQIRAVSWSVQETRSGTGELLLGFYLVVAVGVLVGVMEYAWSSRILVLALVAGGIALASIEHCAWREGAGTQQLSLRHRAEERPDAVLDHRRHGAGSAGCRVARRRDERLQLTVGDDAVVKRLRDFDACGRRLETRLVAPRRG